MRELTEFENREINTLKAELSELETKRDKMRKVHASRDGMALNPAGDIGGIRSRSAKRKAQMFDRWTKDATESINLNKAIAGKKAEIRLLENAPKRDAQAEGAKNAGDTITAFMRANVKAGDKVEFLPNPQTAPTIVRRVNAKSVSLEPYGERYEWNDIFPCKPDGTYYSPIERIKRITDWTKENAQ